MTALILTVALTAPSPMIDWQTAYDRFPRWVPAPPSLVSDDPVERWRPLVEEHFAPPDVDLALRVIGCESDGIPTAKNPRSSASGLFQHLGRFWPERSAAAGWAGSSIFDPEANVAVAAWLRQDGWHHWNPSRGCWG